MSDSTATSTQTASTGDIPKTMKAVVAYAPGDYRYEEVPVPEIDDKEILVKVEGCGICAGDIKSYDGAPSFWGDETQPAYIKAPMIPGHEFIVRVVKVGAEVEGYAVGDRVISEQIVPCWDCRFCHRGQYWMCQIHDIYGFRQRTFGAMAEYMLLPKRSRNYVVPYSLPTEHAVYVEPLGCAVHAVQRGEIAGDHVVVSVEVHIAGPGDGCAERCAGARSIPAKEDGAVEPRVDAYAARVRAGVVVVRRAHREVSHAVVIEVPHERHRLSKAIAHIVTVYGVNRDLSVSKRSTAQYER